MKRRTFVAGLCSTGLLFSGTDAENDPWPANRVMEPSALAAALAGSGPRPTIISVTFPVLYRARHIAGAELAGPTNKPEGIAALKQVVSNLPHGAEIVLYCGCCPMVKCPNIRSAYRTLSGLGYTNVRILNLPTNLHTDWTEKGFPVEPAVMQ